jgi:hypothetical protein
VADLTSRLLEQWRSQTFYIIGAAEFYFFFGVGGELLQGRFGIFIFVFIFLFLHHVMNGYFLNFFLLFLILVLKYNEELSLELCQIFQLNI